MGYAKLFSMQVILQSFGAFPIFDNGACISKMDFEG